MSRRIFVFVSSGVLLSSSGSPLLAQVCSDLTCFVDRGQSGEIVLGHPRGGMAVIDYDNDGFQDLVIADLPPAPTHLFHNVPDVLHPGRRTFEDVASGSGLDDNDNNGLSFAVLTLDYDNDGFQDVYLSGQGQGDTGFARLYRNEGNGHFMNVSMPSGVRGLGITAISASCSDFDLDGNVDILMVGSSGAPAVLRLMHNNGDGTFSNGNGFLPTLPATGTVYAHGWNDYDEDGYADVFIPATANPMVLRNESDGAGGRRFAEVAGAIGFTSLGPAPMGVAFGDHDNDGDFDLCLTDATGGTYFTDLGSTLMQVYPFDTIFGWGTTWIDVDNDGDLDNYQAGSHSAANYDRLHRNLGGGQWENISSVLNAPLAASQHSVQIDFNNDGRQDIVTINPGSPQFVVSVYENISTTPNHWLKVRLVGDGVEVNRDAIGAVVRVTAGGSTQVRQVVSGSSTNSTEDLRTHFGMGGLTTVEKIEVLWPRAGTLGDRTQILDGPFAVDQILTLVAAPTDCGPVYGDVFPYGSNVGDCLVNLDDILCVLRGFSEADDCPTADIWPCEGDAVVNLDDILKVIGAFAGEAACL